MRRSVHVFAPLVASVALTLTTGAARAEATTVGLTASAPVSNQSSTQRRGLGESFANNWLPWIVGGVVAGGILFGSGS